MHAGTPTEIVYKLFKVIYCGIYIAANDFRWNDVLKRKTVLEWY